LEQFAIEILQKTEMQEFIFAKKKRNFMSTKMLGSVIINHNWSNLVHQDFADFLGIIVGAELPIIKTLSDFGDGIPSPKSDKVLN